MSRVAAVRHKGRFLGEKSVVKSGVNRIGAPLLVGAVLILSGCAAPRSNRPLLSAPPSAAADNDIYTTDNAGRVHALRPDGTEQWVLSLPDEIARLDAAASRDIRVDYLAARSGGKLFGLATQETGRKAGDTILFALDGNHLIWEEDVPFPEQNGGPVAVGTTAVYEAGDDGVLYAFSRSDGHQLWKYQVSRGALGSPTVGADGTVYVTGPRHNLHAVAPDGTERWVNETQK
ncbi:MAG: PQQ-binding-like beta-propeller repeat protein [Acidobacteria bacterium]|nr:PQQ-binding-like beta-propeller repeat protein [Acidobacteriota bacterium]